MLADRSNWFLALLISFTRYLCNCTFAIAIIWVFRIFWFIILDVSRNRVGIIAQLHWPITNVFFRMNILQERIVFLKVIRYFSVWEIHWSILTMHPLSIITSGLLSIPQSYSQKISNLLWSKFFKILQDLWLAAIEKRIWHEDENVSLVNKINKNVEQKI